MKQLIRKILYSNPITKAICLKRAKRIEWRKNILPIKKYCKRNKNAVFLVMTPEHGNIGDHAIAFAEREFLKRLNIEYYELTKNTISYLKSKGELGVLNGATIMVNGGGNLGTLWFNIEELTRELIIANPNSKIIMMPNTFYYEDSAWGKEELAKSIKIYNAHPNLHIFAREKTSYLAMKGIYNNVEAVCDMVLSLYYPDKKQERSGCQLCFRRDVEKTMPEDAEIAIRNIAEKYFTDSVSQTDMVVTRSISIEDGESEVVKKIEEFQSSKLVITDRLHGMVFCAISETPCIVVNSKSHKVKGIYDKLKPLPYIKFADSVEQVDTLIPAVFFMDYVDTAIFFCVFVANFRAVIGRTVVY